MIEVIIRSIEQACAWQVREFILMQWKYTLGNNLLGNCGTRAYHKKFSVECEKKNIEKPAAAFLPI